MHYRWHSWNVGALNADSNTVLILARFLLSKLYLDSLKDKYTTREVKDTLQAIEDGSTDLLTIVYDNAIKRIESQPEKRRDWARRVLSWVLHAHRPLTCGEIRHALAIKLGEYQIDPESLPYLGEIVSFCAGLVTLDYQNNVIQFVHYTTKQYFESVQERYGWTRNAPVEISKLCLTYISFKSFASGFTPDDESFEKRMTENSFLDYAAHCWGYHVRDVQKDSQIRKLAKSFLQHPLLTSSIGQAMFAQAEARFRSHGYSQHAPRMTGLHLAAVFGLDVLLSDLLSENQSDVDERDSHNQTPLYLAALRGHEKVVRLLLERDADVGAKESEERTALHMSAANEHDKVMLLLLQHKADVDIKDKWGWTALHRAAINKHETAVRHLLKYKTNIDAKDNGGRTVLHRVAERGYKSVVGLLLKHKAGINIKDDRGRTPLHEAAEQGHEIVVTQLLEHKADVNAKDNDKWTALHIAAANGHEKAASELLSYEANIKARDKWERTALHISAENGYEEVTRLLLGYEINTSLKDRWGQTALHIAASNGHVAVAQLLKADVNARTMNGWTAIHEASLNGHEEVVRLLLKGEADINAKTDDGRTALHEAAAAGYDGVVQLLLEYQADIEMEDAEGLTALDEAERNDNEKVVRLLEGKKESR
jgi:ankyrin repeat protein